ncbi:MAG: GNAT family N-acetyltransferase [Anaerolineae bacterium]|nr:GNAT family N-acetyltransferase [Anaerolineae bacterium]MDW8171835.1 GNAT family N-acetyltransferase [Anaerolineae bacterium]
MDDNGIRIDIIRPQYAKGLERLQRDCFPTLADSELMREEHFLMHCKLFPEGNFVALHGERVVGLGAGFLIDFDFRRPQHRFMDILAHGYYTNHNPKGAYYYGADMSVHPDYRRRGIARRLYDARKGIIRKLNRRGLVAGGLIPDYAKHKAYMSAEEYVARVVAGELYDSTLSVQLKNGFRVVTMLRDYIEDSASDNWAALILWENPDYDRHRHPHQARA